MIALNAHFDGKVIVPDDPFNLPTNQKLRNQIEPIESAQPLPKPNRVLGQQRDLVVSLAPDWEAPFPDDIWEHDQDGEAKP